VRILLVLVRILQTFLVIIGSLLLSGMYFSLQHLSLSDATVLTFIAPILTGFSGAVFLKETLSIGEVLAGCKHLITHAHCDCHSSDDSMQLPWGRVDIPTAFSVRQSAGVSGSV
jgi:threonine/homoserine efflux transporter RhtA